MRRYIIETENLSLDVDESLAPTDDHSWRLTLNDKYGHYESEAYLRKNQLYDLLLALKGIEDELSMEDFSNK